RPSGIQPSFFSLTKSSAMIGPFLTTSADTPGGGAAGRSARRAASRGGRSTAAPSALSSQKGAGAAPADRVLLRPGQGVPEAPADAPGPAPTAVRREGRSSPLAALSLPRTGA